MNIEAHALQKVEKLSGQTLLYHGKEKKYSGASGKVEVLEDMNCCAPTNNVLFSFQMEKSRKVMTAAECLDFLADCSPVQS